MSVRELAESDLAITLSGDDFGVTFSIQSIGSGVWTSTDINGDPLRGKLNRVGTIKNPQNNLRSVVNRTAISVRISTLPFAISENMPVKTNDINSNLIEGVCKNIQNDHVLGFLTFDIESVSNMNAGTIQKRRGIL